LIFSEPSVGRARPGAVPPSESCARSHPAAPAALPATPCPPGERGLVMMTILSVSIVLTLLAALVLFLVGRETTVSALRLTGQKSLYIAEGGAVQARAALMAYIGAYPTGLTTVDSSLTPATANGWYANGIASVQNPLGLLDYLVVDGQRFTLLSTSSTPSATLQVNWGLATPHLKLQVAGTPANPLGDGSYTATVTLTPRLTADPSCAGGKPCAIHLVAGTTSAYELFYNYKIASTGSVPPSWRRGVTYVGNFSVYLNAQSFARYALFTDTHTDANGNAVWFANPTTFSGPVYTNGEFRFYQFPTFTSTVQSAGTKAWYYNNGNPIELAAVENVRNGTRIDAALVPPDPNPQAAAPANFTLGAPPVPFPSDAYNQQGVAIGLTPGNYTQLTAAQIDAAVPELKGTNSVPNGVYVPVSDTAGTCVSNPGNPMLGGVYVQGDVDSLTLSPGGPLNSQAVYTFTQGKITTTVTVDRTLSQTTVTMSDDKGNNAWPQPSNQGGCLGLPQGPMTRVFAGVPKGWQGPGNANGAIIYVQGQINSFSGTLQQNEQTTIAASGTITIQGNVQYQTPPNPSDPHSNPPNILGLFSSGGDIVIGQSAPDNVTIQAILMAGTSANAYKSVVTVQNYNGGPPRGTANLLGGIIEKYYGAFGVLNGQGGVQSGYGRNFTYDTRVSRGFAPPFFPGTSNFQVNQGSTHIAGVKPVWSEIAPP